MLGLAFSLVTLMFNLLVQLMVLTLRFGFLLVRLTIWAVPVFARITVLAIRVVWAFLPVALAAGAALCTTVASISGLIFRRLRDGRRDIRSSSAASRDVA